MSENNFYEEYNDSSYSKNGVEVTTSTKAMIKVFLWMFIGVFITFITGVICSEVLYKSIASENEGVVLGFLIAAIIAYIVEFIMCFAITKNAMEKMNPKLALVEFMIFSVLNGISFTFLFCFLEVSFLYQIFAFVSLYFLVLTGVSFLFKSKLNKLSTFAMVGLITLLITSIIGGIVSFFIYGTQEYYTLYLGISILGLIVFTILTIVDVKKVKEVIDSNTDNSNGAAIIGAFTLYLDFINIFIYVLRIAIMISGKGRKN